MKFTFFFIYLFILVRNLYNNKNFKSKKHITKPRGIFINQILYTLHITTKTFTNQCLLNVLKLKINITQED